MIHAFRGVGKTHLSVGIAIAVATGTEFLKWKAETPRGVLLIDGEMPGSVLQERIKQVSQNMGQTLENVNLNIITPDLQTHGMPDLSTTDGQLLVESFITEKTKLIVLDNISTLCRSGEENKSDSWRQMQEWILQLRARGKSVLLIHHDGKGGLQRGHSKKEDILDTVIQLKRPSQYSPEDGAVFEVHFKKSRGLFGPDVEPFEASLRTDALGKAEWFIKKLDDSMRDKVRKLLYEGYKQKDIAEELGVTPGRISQLVKQIKSH